MDAGYLRKRGIVHILAELFGNSTHAFGRFRNAHLLSSVRCPFLEGVPILNSDTPPFIIRSWNEQVTEYHQLGNVYRANLDISIGFEKRSLVTVTRKRRLCRHAQGGVITPLHLYIHKERPRMSYSAVGLEGSPKGRRQSSLGSRRCRTK